MFVVAGVTGNTGSVVASSLLAQKQPVRVIVRDEAKGQPWRAQGAEVAVTSLDDTAGLTRALTGAQGAYLLLPPDAKAADFLAYGRNLADRITGALRETAVPHVVYLSSVGAHHAAGTGPIRSHHYGEQKVREATRTKFTFLRPAYFMENLAMLLGAVRQQGVLPAFFSPETKIDMIATRDIGQAATQALLAPPAQTQVIELAGPETYSFTDAAQAFSAALNTPVTPVRVPDEGVVPALLQAGLAQSLAELYLEMSQGVAKGLLGFEGGQARLQRGPTRLDTFVQELVR